MTDFFADTYALIEMLKGTPNYKKYSKEPLITTEFNMLELSYALIRDFADQALTMLKLVREDVEVVDTRDEDYIEASRLRTTTKKQGKNLSLIDCLGYTFARAQRARSLTILSQGSPGRLRVGGKLRRRMACLNTLLASTRFWALGRDRGGGAPNTKPESLFPRAEGGLRVYGDA